MQSVQLWILTCAGELLFYPFLKKHFLNRLQQRMQLIFKYFRQNFKTLHHTTYHASKKAKTKPWEFFTKTAQPLSYYNIISKHNFCVVVLNFKNKLAFGLIYIPCSWSGLSVKISPTCSLLLILQKKVGQHYWSCTVYADCSRNSIKA